MGKKRRSNLQQINADIVPSFTSNFSTDSYLEVGELKFRKLGGFTVDETIAYELMANNSSQRLIDLMVLAQEISHDLGWTYGQSIEALNSCGTEIIPELVGYAHQIREIGLFDFSDTRRKSDLVHQFIILRGYPEWTQEQTRQLLFHQLLAVYNFMMQEYHAWQELPPTDDADLGKFLADSESGSRLTPLTTGENATITSKPPAPAIADTTGTALASN
jgi:hypothetical protein